jgi:hypothetical protein
MTSEEELVDGMTKWANSLQDAGVGLGKPDFSVGQKLVDLFANREFGAYWLGLRQHEDLMFDLIAEVGVAQRQAPMMAQGPDAMWVYANRLRTLQIDSVIQAAHSRDASERGYGLRTLCRYAHAEDNTAAWAALEQLVGDPAIDNELLTMSEDTDEPARHDVGAILTKLQNTILEPAVEGALAQPAWLTVLMGMMPRLRGVARRTVQQAQAALEQALQSAAEGARLLATATYPAKLAVAHGGAADAWFDLGDGIGKVTIEVENQEILLQLTRAQTLAGSFIAVNFDAAATERLQELTAANERGQCVLWNWAQPGCFLAYRAVSPEGDLRVLLGTTTRPEDAEDSSRYLNFYQGIKQGMTVACVEPVDSPIAE